MREKESMNGDARPNFTVSPPSLCSTNGTACFSYVCLYIFARISRAHTLCL